MATSRIGDIELDDYLTNAAGPVLLVLDLRLVHDRFGSRSDPSHYNNRPVKEYVNYMSMTESRIRT